MKERTQLEIEQMYDFIGFFNDGLFMNQDYRKGLLQGLGYARGYGDLDNLRRKLKEMLDEFNT